MKEPDNFTKRKGRRIPRRFIILLVCVLITLLFPFKSTVVPAWKLRVVDESGNPVKGIAILYVWQQYSFEFNGHEERAHTDENGYVSFPERTARASLLQRMFVPIVNVLTTGAHASFGPDGHIMVWGRPDEFMTEIVSYNGTTLPPERLVLRRAK